MRDVCVLVRVNDADVEIEEDGEMSDGNLITFENVDGGFIDHSEMEGCMFCCCRHLKGS